MKIIELIGKTTINPILFYSGKISGYITWAILVLSLMDLNIVCNHSFIEFHLIAYGIIVIGLLMVIFSLINLGNSTRLGLPSEKTEFKCNGLYKISRNPMYVGFNLLTISSIIYFLNIIVLLLGVYSLTIYHLIIIGEERFLQNRFGEVYLNYKKKVRRYI